jgi:serine/threonine protein kinase
MLMRKAAEPARLGRFQILKLLGRGAQGQVYLAEDTQLKRRVAIKTLELNRGARDGVQRIRALLDEALIVSQLAHPHIVPLFDAGEQDGQPWLVFEYVEGKTLAAILREAGRLEPERALRIAAQVLEAVGSAHARGIIHCDIKPANVMLSASGDARVMDFGIARLVDRQVSGSTAFAGTPAYLAPETVAGEPHSAASDLFAIGMVLYEALTGAPAIDGQNAFEVMHRLVNEPFGPPSARVSGLDERLDDLVLKAIAKNPAERYDSARSMAGAILAYLNPVPQAAAGQSENRAGALEFLLRRMRHKSDFPALSNTISAVNRASASDTEQVGHLSNSILKDFALTNKLLKLVNSAHYGQYRGSISTVSRAVVIIGFDNIRNVAVTLMLLEHLQNKAQAAQLKDEIIATLFSGLLARQLASKTGVRSSEEAFICAMFHRLGRLLTAFYFHEEFQEIGKRCRQGGIDEEAAALAVLGLSFEELGIGVARAWHFPERLTGTLRRVTEDRPRKPASDEQRLRVLAEMAGYVSDAARETDPATRRARIAALATRFGDGLGVSEQHLASAAESAAQELVRETGLLDFKPAQSPLYCALSDWGRSGAAAQPGAPRAADTLETALGTATLRDSADSAAPPAPSLTPENATAVLTAGAATS